MFEERQQKPYPSQCGLLKKRTAFIPFPSYNHLKIKVFSSKMKYMETWIPKILLHSLHFLFFFVIAHLIENVVNGKRSKVYVISSRGTRNSWCTDLNKKLCHTQDAVLVYLLQCFKLGIWKIKKTTNFNRKMSYQTTLNVILTPF